MKKRSMAVLPYLLSSPSRKKASPASSPKCATTSDSEQSPMQSRPRSRTRPAWQLGKKGNLRTFVNPQSTKGVDILTLRVQGSTEHREGHRKDSSATPSRQEGAGPAASDQIDSNRLLGDRSTPGYALKQATTHSGGLGHISSAHTASPSE